jgi:isocitrate/isopropylmalate dehydrogenase
MFDVIVTNNLFSDIITASARRSGREQTTASNLHPGRTSMFEPVTLGAATSRQEQSRTRWARSSRRVLDHLGLKPEAAAIEAAVQDAVSTGSGTAEIGGA